MLGWRPLATIGLVSYGAYLWQPFVQWSADWRYGTILGLTLPFAAGAVSWLLIERPVIRWSRSVGDSVDLRVSQGTPIVSDRADRESTLGRELARVDPSRPVAEPGR